MANSKLEPLRAAERDLVTDYIAYTRMHDYDHVSELMFLDIARERGIPAALRSNMLAKLCRAEIFSIEVNRDLEKIVKIHPSFAEEAYDYYVDEESDTKVQIPASDRFVSIDHNSAELIEAVNKLVELEERVDFSNEFAADNEQRLAIKQELAGIRELLSGSKVRIASIFAAVSGSGILRWLAAHASDAILSSIAGQTISLLSKAFGFGA